MTLKMKKLKSSLKKWFVPSSLDISWTFDGWIGSMHDCMYTCIWDDTILSTSLVKFMFFPIFYYLSQSFIPNSPRQEPYVFGNACRFPYDCLDCALQAYDSILSILCIRLPSYIYFKIMVFGEIKRARENTSQQDEVMIKVLLLRMVFSVILSQMSKGLQSQLDIHNHCQFQANFCEWSFQIASNILYCQWIKVLAKTLKTNKRKRSLVQSQFVGLNKYIM